MPYIRNVSPPADGDTPLAQAARRALNAIGVFFDELRFSKIRALAPSPASSVVPTPAPFTRPMAYNTQPITIMPRRERLLSNVTMGHHEISRATALSRTNACLRWKWLHQLTDSFHLLQLQVLDRNAAARMIPAIEDGLMIICRAARRAAVIYFSPQACHYAIASRVTSRQSNGR